MEEIALERILIAQLIVFPALLIAAALLLRERRTRALLGRPQGEPVLPSAQETRRSIVRFQEAVRRDQMLDFIWERWLRSRAFFFR